MEFFSLGITLFHAAGSTFQKKPLVLYLSNTWIYYAQPKQIWTHSESDDVRITGLMSSTILIASAEVGLALLSSGSECQTQALTIIGYWAERLEIRSLKGQETSFQNFGLV